MWSARWMGRVSGQVGLEVAEGRASRMQLLCSVLDPVLISAVWSVEIKLRLVRKREAGRREYKQAISVFDDTFTLNLRYWQKEGLKGRKQDWRSKSRSGSSMGLVPRLALPPRFLTSLSTQSMKLRKTGAMFLLCHSWLKVCKKSFNWTYRVFCFFFFSRYQKIDAPLWEYFCENQIVHVKSVSVVFLKTVTISN